MKIRGCLWKEGANGLGVRLPIVGLLPLPYRKRFDVPARRHDAMYDKGGDGWNRAYYDQMFGQWCWRYAHSRTARVFAVIYYIVVRLFGWLFFNYKKE